MGLQYIYLNGAWHYLGDKAETACGIAVADKWSHARTPVAVGSHCVKKATVLTLEERHGVVVYR